MAMSDYDLLAFDDKAKPCNGIFSIGHSSVQIYKNWLYVQDEKMWKKSSSSYVKPTIAQIESGTVYLSDFLIVSERHDEQGSIFCFCKSDKKMFAGIGCRGYLNTTRIYVEKLHLDKNKDWHSQTSYEGDKTTESLVCLETGEEHEVPKKFLVPENKQWIGVSKTTYSAFLKFLDRTEKDFGNPGMEKWFKMIKKSKPLRFNQGDAFFARHLKKRIPAGKIGKNRIPLAIQMIKEVNYHGDKPRGFKPESRSR